MVFGNAGGASGAGVGFTRDPATGARDFYFDFQFNGQGEDVVAGRQRLGDNDRLRTALPAVCARLNEICRELEALFGDAQDFEFTVQSGTLFLLQTRRAKRTDWAALRIAVDMVDEGLLTPAEALAAARGHRPRARSCARASRRRCRRRWRRRWWRASAWRAGPSRSIVDAVEAPCGDGPPAILVRRDTATTDIDGMALAAGILTASGGRTSHAAVVARQLGKVCLVACAELRSIWKIASAGSAGRVRRGRLDLARRQYRRDLSGASGAADRAARARAEGDRAMARSGRARRPNR